MLSPLTEDALVDFFKEGAKMRGPLVAFSSTVLHGWNTFHQGCADSELFKFLWEHDVLSPMVDAADRLQKICCCVLHIFCAESEVPPLIQASSDALVLMFYNYAGNEVFERTFKRVLRDGWWNAEIQDMLKKGGSAALVQAKAADLKDLLSASSCLSTSFLTQPNCFQRSRTKSGHKKSRVSLTPLRLLGLSLSVGDFYFTTTTHSFSTAQTGISFGIVLL